MNLTLVHTILNYGVRSAPTASSERSILDKILKFKPLKDWDITINYGIKTGFNEAFIIDEATKERLIKEDSKSAEIIKPLLRGRDIKRYCYDYNDLYLICTFPALNLNIENYPAIKKYLESFGKRLEQSGEKGCRKKTNNKWFETQDNIAYYEYFETDKIAWQRITDKNKFVFSEKGQYILDSMAFISGFKNIDEAYYILSILNSELVYFWIKHNVHEYGDTGFRLSNQYVELIPIATADENTKNKLVSLVDDIIRLKKNNKDSSDIEAEVDKIVYSLYGLTDNEIRIIEGN